ncbi:MAG: sigma-70 family RNA polymerase sigma factor [Prolixibacteraceae bacterium]
MKEKISHSEDEGLLWKKMKMGDQHSFSVIFRFYYPKLYTYGLKLVPFPDLVRDQIQNLFVNIWQSREGLGDISNLKAYLLTSLRRRLFNSRLKRTDTEPIENLSEKDQQSWLFEATEFFDSDFISSGVREQLIKNLNSLPVNQREIIFLRFSSQLTYREIADIVHVKEQSVKNNMPKILQKLAEGITGVSREDIRDIDIMLFNLFLLFQKK